MAVSADEYLKALRDINAALTTGLQSAIAIIENYEKLTEEQRKSVIIQMKQLVETSHNAYGPEPTELWFRKADKVVWLSKEIYMTYPVSRDR